MSIWPFFGAILAALTALFIAILVYPWQKQIERRIAYDKDIRSAFSEYVSAEARLMVISQAAASDEVRERALPEYYAALAEFMSAIKRIQILSLPGHGIKLDRHANSTIELSWTAAIAGKPAEGKSLVDVVEAYNKDVGEFGGQVRDYLGRLSLNDETFGNYLRVRFGLAPRKRETSI